MKRKDNISNRKFSITSILNNDYISFISWLFPIIMFAMALFIEIFGFFPDLKRGRAPLTTEAIPFFIQFGIITLLIGFLIILLRINKIKNLFDKGIEVDGEVTNFFKYRDRGRIYFTYKSKNVECDNSNVVHFNKKTNKFLPHTKVKILFKEDNYFKAIIKDLFV